MEPLEIPSASVHRILDLFDQLVIPLALAAPAQLLVLWMQRRPAQSAFRRFFFFLVAVLPAYAYLLP